MYRVSATGWILVLLIALGCVGPLQSSPAADASEGDGDPTLLAKAETLAKRFIIVDGHVDLPYRLLESRADDGSLTEDISGRTASGDFDYVRARAGGLDAPFMSIYVPARYQTKGGAKQHADKLIDMVEGIVQRWPDKFALATTPADIEARFRAGRIALPMGIENGAAIEDDLDNVRHFYERGIRYVTLTHSKDNQICDSSYDDKRTWKGLSPFGRQVVAEMNRLGIMVDVSHVSDQAFDQVMEITKVPVIASHSSARHFTPGFERNMSDDMIRRLGKNGGVIMINFGSSFIYQAAREYGNKRRRAVRSYAAKHNLDNADAKVEAYAKKWTRNNQQVFADVTQVADHIEHVIKLVGVDHVGFGSDFDGVGDTLPVGLKDAAHYPRLIQVLLERGYSEQDIEKICSGNLLRVWRAVQAYAAAQSASSK